MWYLDEKFEPQWSNYTLEGQREAAYREAMWALADLWRMSRYQVELLKLRSYDGFQRLLDKLCERRFATELYRGQGYEKELFYSILRDLEQEYAAEKEKKLLKKTVKPS